MKFNNKKVILFDLDGTLIDSVPDLTLAVNYMLKSLEYAQFSEELVRSWVGNGAETLVKRSLLAQTDIKDSTIDEKLLKNALEIFLTFYAKNLCVNTVTYPYVSQTLKNLKSLGYHLAIVTNKPFSFVEPILDSLELKYLFEFWIGGDSLSVRKPNPEPLLYACKKMKVSTEQCLMIGDSKNDILAANRANIQSIGLTYGYNYDESIDKYSPNMVLDNFADILTALSKD